MTGKAREAGEVMTAGVVSVMARDTVAALPQSGGEVLGIGKVVGQPGSSESPALVLPLVVTPAVGGIKVPGSCEGPAPALPFLVMPVVVVDGVPGSCEGPALALPVQVVPEELGDGVPGSAEGPAPALSVQVVPAVEAALYAVSGVGGKPVASSGETAAVAVAVAVPTPTGNGGGRRQEGQWPCCDYCSER